MFDTHVQNALDVDTMAESDNEREQQDHFLNKVPMVHVLCMYCKLDIVIGVKKLCYFALFSKLIYFPF